MIEIFPLEDYAGLASPRRVVRYVLIWCSEGAVTLAVDESDFRLEKGQLITITSGQIHYAKSRERVKGWVLEFTFDFFCKDDFDLELVFQNGLFCHFDMNEVIGVPDPATVEGPLKMIRDELTEKPFQYLIALHAYVKLILVAVNRAKISQGEEVYKPDALFLKFLEMVRGNFKRNFTISYFAEALQTTELKLNELAKLHAGKTAQSVVYGLIISEAKRLLTYEKMPVKEVAYELGFLDPFYFSNFFKKHTKLSPKAYKAQAL